VKRPEETDALTQIEEASLSQLPTVITEKRAEVTVMYSEPRIIKVISGLVTEGNRLISEANAIRLEAPKHGLSGSELAIFSTCSIWCRL
jgi:hypothetical protein